MKDQADIMSLFSGALNLSNANGTVYRTHNQSGALSLSVAGNQVINGWATVPIVADGSPITVPGAWIKYGGDDISIVAGQTNHFLLTWTGEFYYYTNKVV